MATRTKMNFKIHTSWRNDSVVKSSECSDTGPGFSCQQTHDTLQPSVTFVSGELMSYSSLQGHQGHVVHIHTHAKCCT